MQTDLRNVIEQGAGECYDGISIDQRSDVRLVHHVRYKINLLKVAFPRYSINFVFRFSIR